MTHIDWSEIADIRHEASAAFAKLCKACRVPPQQTNNFLYRVTELEQQIAEYARQYVSDDDGPIETHRLSNEIGGGIGGESMNTERPGSVKPISASGVILRAADACKRDHRARDLNYPLRQLYGHLKEVKVMHDAGRSKEALELFFAIWIDLEQVYEDA